jgi:hypothetical protein
MGCGCGSKKPVSSYKRSSAKKTSSISKKTYTKSKLKIDRASKLTRLVRASKSARKTRK